MKKIRVESISFSNVSSGTVVNLYETLPEALKAGADPRTASECFKKTNNEFFVGVVAIHNAGRDVIQVYSDEDSYETVE